MRIALITVAALCLTAAASAPDVQTFDRAAFHEHAAALHHTVVQTPTCVGHKGLRGVFVMEVPQQEFFPLSVTTIVGPTGIATNLTTSGDSQLSDADAKDIGDTFNDQAEVLVTKIISDCKSEDT